MRSELASTDTAGLQTDLRGSLQAGRGEFARPGLPLLACLVFLLVHPLSVTAHPAEFERIEVLTRRIEAEPLNPSLHIDRAASYSHDGEYAQAMKDLRKAEELGDPVFVAYELGLLHYRKGELSEAKVQFDRFVERFPNHALALEKRARLLAEMGETQAAVTDYERVFALTPRPNPGSYLSAAKLFASDAEAGLAPALAMLDRGMQRLGVIPQLQQYAIEIELLGSRNNRALERLESLKSVLGGGPEWNVQMAELLIRMEKIKQARRHLSTATKTLRGLRQTPARTELAKRIGVIEKELDAP